MLYVTRKCIVKVESGEVFLARYHFEIRDVFYFQKFLGEVRVVHISDLVWLIPYDDYDLPLEREAGIKFGDQPMGPMNVLWTHLKFGLSTLRR